MDEINYDKPENAKSKILFENFTPLFANKRFHLEIGNGSTEDITARTIDLCAPIGKGQRGLIVSPPKAGKTMMLQNIAQSITHNHPECYVMVLLIETVRRRDLSIKLKERIQQVGFVLILMLMGLVLYFDFVKNIPTGLFSGS